MATHVQPIPRPASANGPGGLQIAAVVLLLGGAFLMVVGWFIGVALLWGSSRWTWQEKLLGTLVVPGGLALPLALTMFPTSTSLSTCVSTNDGPPKCTTETDGFAMDPALGLVAFAILLIAPVVVAAFLLRRATARDLGVRPVPEPA